MSKLNTELFIARRMGSGGRSGESKGVMERIAVATTAISFAVMIVAVGVMAGFKSELTGNMTAFIGHLQVRALDYSSSVEMAPIARNPVLEREIASLGGVRSVAPFAMKMGIVKTDDATQGVVLKGVDVSSDLSFFEKSLTQGALPRLDDSMRHKDILISGSVARMLKLGVGDRVEILFASGSQPPRRDRFRVSGLYSSGMEEMDNRYAITDLASVRRLNGWGDDGIAGYEVALDDTGRIEEMKAVVDRLVARHDAEQRRIMVRSVTDDYPQVFDWLATHDVNAAVVIAIMIVVALVSMISALLIILLERIRMIGILKTLGMRNGSLRRIFVLRSARVVISGLLIGNLVGMGLALVQKYTGFLKLDSEGYLLSTVPVDLGWWWIAALNVGTLVVIVALLVFPTSFVGGITPDKTIRYQ